MATLRLSSDPVSTIDKPNLHGGRVMDFAKKYSLAVDDVIDYSSNISPIGPPKGIRNVLDDEMDRINRYPDDGDVPRQVVADYVGVQAGNVLLGNGSVNLIYLLVNHFKPKKAIVFSPTFSEYERAALSINGDVVHLSLGSDFSLNIEGNRDELIDADMIFICNPNNPTGSLLGAEEILSLKNIALKSRIIVDEAFMDFCGDELSVISKAMYDDRLIVLRSMGKFFSLAGLRIGYLIAEKNVVSDLERKNPPWTVSSIASAATIEAVTDKEFISVSKKAIKSLREDLMKDLRGISGIHAFPSCANFLLLKTTRNGWNSRKIQNYLAKEAILIREADDFVYLDETYFRIGIRKSEDNNILSDILKRILK